jgi:hypothetical protein
MKIKVAIASLAVAAIVVSAFAFTTAKKATNKKLVGQWFVYIGDQSSSNPASLSDARNRDNYQYMSEAVATSGAGYLRQIFVQASEIDDNGTPSLTDDLPKVDVSSTDIFAALGAAKDPSTGLWSDMTPNTATIDADGQP